MSLFAQFIPDSTNGLAITIRSAEAAKINEALKWLVDNPGKKVNYEKQFGYSKRFFDGYRQADLFLDSFGHLRSDDEIQYDKSSNTLFAVGQVVEDGKHLNEHFDEKMARLAEHIYMSYHETMSVSAQNDRFHGNRESSKGKDVDYINLHLTNSLMVGVFLQYSMAALQLFLRRKIKALIPLLIGSGKKDSVTAVANGLLLDPKKYQEHVEDQVRGLFEHLVVKDP